MKQKSAQRIQIKINNRKKNYLIPLLPEACLKACEGEGLSEIQRKEMWKELNEKGSDCNDSWEPVCAVRDKPEKQNLVRSGGGREECCF